MFETITHGGGLYFIGRGLLGIVSLGRQSRTHNAIVALVNKGEESAEESAE